MDSKKFFQKYNVPSSVNTIILAVVIIVFAVLCSWVSSRVSDNAEAISRLETQTESLQSQLSSASSIMTTLLGQLNDVNWQITALEQQTASLRSGNSTLQSQLSVVETQIILLQSEARRLRDGLSAGGPLPLPITVFLETISQDPSTQTTVYTFGPKREGSLSISGISSSSTGYIIVKSNTTGDSTTYAFGVGTTVTAPLSAAHSYSIIFGNQDSYGTITATLTGLYQQL